MVASLKRTGLEEVLHPSSDGRQPLANRLDPPSQPWRGRQRRGSLKRAAESWGKIHAYVATGRAKRPAETTRKVGGEMTQKMRQKLRRAGYRSRYRLRPTRDRDGCLMRRGNAATLPQSVGVATVRAWTRRRDRRAALRRSSPARRSAAYWRGSSAVRLERERRAMSHRAVRLTIPAPVWHSDRLHK